MRVLIAFIASVLVLACGFFIGCLSNGTPSELKSLRTQWAIASPVLVAVIDEAVLQGDLDATRAAHYKANLETVDQAVSTGDLGSALLEISDPVFTEVVAAIAKREQAGKLDHDQASAMRIGINAFRIALAAYLKANAPPEAPAEPPAPPASE